MSKRRGTLPKGLFLMGPTAAGKTALAVELTRQGPFEIVSVDSAMVYKGLDIGTAKPDSQTLATSPHCLINIRDPAVSYSAADFRRDALQEMQRINSAGKVPLLVGGTMLYFRILRTGMSALPASDAIVRKELLQILDNQGLDFLYQRLMHYDSAAAERIHGHDKQRILRALEIIAITGQTVTALYEHDAEETLPWEITTLAINVSNREELHRRIETRFFEMLEQGFIEEVEKLKAQSNLNLEKPAMRAVGYRQIWQYLEGQYSHQEMIQRCLAATRQLAKRQITWLRSEKKSFWIDCLDNFLVEKTSTVLRNRGLMR